MNRKTIKTKPVALIFTFLFLGALLGFKPHATKAQSLMPVLELSIEVNGYSTNCHQVMPLDDPCNEWHCNFPTHICEGQIIEIQGLWTFTAPDPDSQCDSIVIDISSNLIGPTHIVYPGTFISNYATPIIPVSFLASVPPSQTQSFCMTLYFSDAQGNFACSRICMHFNVDPVPYFNLHVDKDSVCPVCNHQPGLENIVCIHIDSTGFDWNDPHLITDIQWGRPGNFWTWTDSCVFYLQTGYDTIIVTVTNDCGTYSDTAIIVVTLFPEVIGPDSVCLNAPFTLTASSRCDSAALADFAWDMGDGTIYAGPNYASVSHIYQNAGTYVIELEIIDSCGNHDSTLYYIYVYDAPPKPEIIGPNNVCAADAIYSIANPNPNYVYVWDILDPSYGGPFPQIGSLINVTWVPMFSANAEHTVLYVTVIDEHGCESVDSLHIWKCCSKDQSTSVMIHDITITDATVFSSGVPVYVNGTITIDGNVQIVSGQHIFMGPESRFLINPSCTLTISNRTIWAGCEYMWDGIHIPTVDATLIVNNNSRIMDAFNAVYSKNGGKFFLDNSKFHNNYISVLAEDYYSTTQQNPLPPLDATITKCAFEKSGQGLIAPYLGHNPYYGIYLDDIHYITIGDSSNQQYKNKFKKLFCGIASFNSRANVYNNEFSEIQPSSPCVGVYGNFTSVQCPVAIHAVQLKKTAVLPYLSSLSCGGRGVASRNTFDKCLTGIYTYKTITRIRSNVIKKTPQGILVRDFVSGAYIVNNYLYDGVTSGIRVINTLPIGKQKITVKDNTIVDPMRGIEMMNVLAHPLFMTVVANNTIKLNGSTKTNRYGIKLDNCGWIDASCNQITRSGNVPSGDKLKIKGIELNQTTKAWVRDNVTQKLGLGIKGAGSLEGVLFKCNTSDKNHHGFYFDNPSVISDQYTMVGSDTIPFDNKWIDISPGDFRIFGNYSGNAIFWHYRMGGVYYPKRPLSLVQKIILNNAWNPSQSSCTDCQFSISHKIPKNSKEIANIMNGMNNYNILDDQFKYYEKQYAYRTLTDTSESHTIDEIAYRDLLSATTIGKFQKVFDLIGEDAISDAYSENNNIDVVTNIESNRMWANKVYFDFVECQQEIPQNIIDQLIMLANASPFEEGDAVYTARAIVDYEEPEIKKKSFEEFEDAVTDLLENGLIVYPNPANNKLNIEITGEIENEYIFELFNAYGIKTFECRMTPENIITSIDVSFLKPGLYWFRATEKLSARILAGGKLIISK